MQLCFHLARLLACTGPLELRARVKEIKGRKVIVNIELLAHEQVCARGEIVTVQVPDEFMARLMGDTASDE